MLYNPLICIKITRQPYNDTLLRLCVPMLLLKTSLFFQFTILALKFFRKCFQTSSLHVSVQMHTSLSTHDSNMLEKIECNMLLNLSGIFKYFFVSFNTSFFSINLESIFEKHWFPLKSSKSIYSAQFFLE